MTTLEVVAAGPGATIQDLGRPDAAPLGVPPGGACDPWSLAASNLLLGNDAGAPALEVAFGGVELRARDTLVVAIAGADLGARVGEAGHPLRPGGSHLVWAGTTITFDGRPANSRIGARAYVAVPGGFDIEPVLGSASTCLVGRFGGLAGRAVQAGDELRARGHLDHLGAGRIWPVTAAPDPGSVPVRLILGPDGGWFASDAVALLTETEWRVGADSNRVGVRLEGPAVPRRSGDIVSFPMTWGAIQVPPDGAPIVLLADHQTVGGYPVIATVARVDRPLIGQLAPGDVVRFTVVDLPTAHEAYRSQLGALREATRLVTQDETWHELWKTMQG